MKLLLILSTLFVASLCAPTDLTEVLPSNAGEELKSGVEKLIETNPAPVKPGTAYESVDKSTNENTGNPENDQNIPSINPTENVTPLPSVVYSDPSSNVENTNPLPGTGNLENVNPSPAVENPSPIGNANPSSIAGDVTPLTNTGNNPVSNTGNINPVNEYPAPNFVVPQTGFTGVQPVFSGYYPAHGFTGYNPFYNYGGYHHQPGYGFHGFNSQPNYPANFYNHFNHHNGRVNPTYDFNSVYPNNNNGLNPVTNVIGGNPGDGINPVPSVGGMNPGDGVNQGPGVVGVTPDNTGSQGNLNPGTNAVNQGEGVNPGSNGAATIDQSETSPNAKPAQNENPIAEMAREIRQGIRRAFPVLAQNPFTNLFNGYQQYPQPRYYGAPQGTFSNFPILNKWTNQPNVGQAVPQQ